MSENQIGTQKKAPSLRVEVVADLTACGFLSELVGVYLDSFGGSEENPWLVHTRLAVVEAITNVVRHGYPPGQPGPLAVEIQCTDGILEVVLCDQGAPFDPRRPSNAPLPGADDLAEGGYGVPILHTVMDELDYSYSPDEGNRFTLRKRVPV